MKNNYLNYIDPKHWKHEDGGIIKALDGIQFLSLNRTDLKRLNETDEEWKNRVNAIMNAGNIDMDDTEIPETVGSTASSSGGTTSTTTDWTTLYRATGGNETPTTSPQQTTTQTSVATAKPDMSKVRSDRNNNPLNIRFTNIAWLGKKTEGKSDNDFEEFESRDYGWRAAYKNIETKMKRGLNTITKLVSEWAPPSENNTNGYIQFVALKTGIDPNAVITQADLPKIGAAMAAVESGRRDNIDWDDAMRGFKFYLGQPV